jgi:hypothetical protein
MIRIVLSILLPLSMLLSACSDDSVEQVDCAATDLIIEIAKIKYADCGLSNGEITVKATGGEAPYNYAMDKGTLQSSAVFINVTPGFHDFTVTDANGCTRNANSFMVNKEPFPVNTTITPSGCGDNKGSVMVTPIGGVPPYKFQLGENNDNYQSTGIWQELRSGNYGIWVEDANKCFFGYYIYLPSGVSFNDSVAPIIESKCATALCHDGSQAPDFRTFSGIKSNASKIKSKVTDLSMPPDNPLSFEEIQLISCWVDDGALNN